LTYRLQGERYQGVFAELLEHDVAKCWLDEAHGWFDSPAPGLAPSPAGGSTGAARTALIESPFGLAVAREAAGPFFAFRRRKLALRRFTDALHLAAVGVATAQPFAVLLPRRRADPAAVVAERVDAPSLRGWIAGGADVPDGTLADVARALADALARLHRSGLRHRGLDAETVLIEPEVPGLVLASSAGVARAKLGIKKDDRSRARDLVPLLAALRELSSEALDLDRELWRPLLARYADRTGDDATALDAWVRGRA